MIEKINERVTFNKGSDFLKIFIRKMKNIRINRVIEYIIIRNLGSFNFIIIVSKGTSIEVIHFNFLEKRNKLKK